VGGEQDLGAVVQEVFQRRDRGPDAGVVGDLEVGVQGDIQVGADLRRREREEGGA